MIPEAALASFVAALFSMMNPIGNVGVFAGMTADRPGDQAGRIAWTCAGAVAVTLLIVAWSGPLLLQFFGITVDSLRAAGGVIVLLIGLHMLFNKAEHKHSPAELEDAASRASIAVVPMAIPIAAGPGAIVALAALSGLLFSFATPILETPGRVGDGRCHARHGHDPRRDCHGHAGRRAEGHVAWAC
jgi:MarC family membrane protein